MKKMMFILSGLELLHESGVFPSVVYQKEANSIEYSLCGLWIHKKACSIKPKHVADQDYVPQS